MGKGFFLVFEGIDKCGKSTQAQLLQRYLEQKGASVLPTREPGGTELGEKIRDLLLHSKGFVENRAELLLYEASRAQHMAGKVLPALKAGKLVVSDRFFLATLAYQGVGRGLAIAEIDRLNKFASFNRAPDLTVVLDIAVDESMRRIGGNPDRMEKRELLDKVRKAYIRFSKTRPNILVVNAHGTLEEVQRRVLNTLQKNAKFKKFLKELG